MPQTQPAEHQIHEAFAELKRLREKATLKLHLASMDAKDRWRDIEDRFTELEHLVRTKAQDSAATGALGKIRDLSDKVTEFIKHQAEKKAH
jgi:hypothetical protein